MVDGDLEMTANFPEGGEVKVQMVTLGEKSWETSDQIYSCNYISSGEWRVWATEGRSESPAVLQVSGVPKALG